MCHMIGGIYTSFFLTSALAKVLVITNDYDDTSRGGTGVTAGLQEEARHPARKRRTQSDATWTQLATMSTPFTPTGSRKSHLILSHKQYSKVLTNVSGTSTRLTSRNRSLELLRASDARDAAVSATIWTRKMKMNIRTELTRLIIPPQVRGVFPFLCRSIRVQSNAPTLNQLPLQGNRRLLRKHPSSGHP